MPNPVAVVTGCASGIGAGLGRALLARGYRLVLCDIDKAGLTNHFGADAGPGLVLHVFDVREEDGWRGVLDLATQSYDRVDLLLNVAGYIKPSFTDNLETAEIRKHLEINTVGPILGMHLFAQVMKRQGYGQIINIASLAGIAPIPGLSLYSASKFGLRGFSLAAAQELREHGVTVTTVCPDAVATPMFDKQIPYKEAAMTFSGGRVLTVDDVVAAVLKKGIDGRALEITLPGSRGLLAKIAGFFPSISFSVGGRLKKKGERVRTELIGKQTQQALDSRVSAE